MFAGYGISATEAGHDDPAGLDLKGKVAVFINGSPASVTGAPAAHYQNSGVRWPTLRAAGAIGTLVPNPRTGELPWARTSPSRLNPALTLGDPRFDELAGQRVAANINPASAERLFAGSPTFGGSARTAERASRCALRAAGGFARAPRMDPTKHSSARTWWPDWLAAIPRSPPSMSCWRAPRSVGVGAAINGDRIYNGAMDNASGMATLIEMARSSPTARRVRSDRCCSWP